jgi:hypothetical protein
MHGTTYWQAGLIASGATDWVVDEYAGQEVSQLDCDLIGHCDASDHDCRMPRNLSTSQSLADIRPHDRER